MLARLWPLILVFAFSCTILDDSDLFEQTQVDELELASVEMEQRTKNALKNGKLTITSDSSYSHVLPELKNIIHLSWPANGNSLKFRSGIPNATELYIIYTKANKPYTVGVLHQNKIVELYRFRYNSQNKLSKIISLIFQPDTVITNDTLLYASNGQLTSIQRRSFDAARQGTFAITYDNSIIGNSENKFSNVKQITFKSNNYNFQGSCLYPYSCVGKSVSGQFGSDGQNPILGFLIYENFGKPESLQFRDLRFRNDNSGFQGSCCRESDTFYFHPLFLVHGQFGMGSFENVLPIIYSEDWWVPGASNSVPNTTQQEDFFKFKFNYALPNAQKK